MTNEVNEVQEPLDRKDLKILAYKEKVAKLEEDNADLRVEVTVLASEYSKLAAQLRSLQESAEDSDVPQSEA